MKNEMRPKEMEKAPGPDRVNAFSDGVFAIIITIMVLDLKKPETPTFSALAQLWPTWISYLVSYLFIAIVWVNHHFLSKYVRDATPGLIWANFGHLFCVALIPFLTAWVAETKLAPLPVAMYALVFLLVNLTYLSLIYQTLCGNRESSASDNDPAVYPPSVGRHYRAVLCRHGYILLVPTAGFHHHFYLSAALSET